MALAFFAGGVPGIGEIGLIALILVLLFGARKLPKLARSLGASLTEFKKGRKEGSDDGKEVETKPNASGTLTAEESAGHKRRE